MVPDDPHLALLIGPALAVRQRAYAPYSRFRVGAALLTEDGQVVVGCNVENASYGLTTCAERNAIAAAVSAGHRRFLALVVAGREPVAPCGACRQVLREFALDLPILLVGEESDQRQLWTLEALLPAAFGPTDLVHAE